MRFSDQRFNTNRVWKVFFGWQSWSESTVQKQTKTSLKILETDMLELHRQVSSNFVPAILFLPFCKISVTNFTSSRCSDSSSFSDTRWWESILQVESFFLSTIDGINFLSHTRISQSLRVQWEHVRSILTSEKRKMHSTKTKAKSSYRGGDCLCLPSSKKSRAMGLGQKSCFHS